MTSLTFFLILLLCIFSASADVFVNIDCGSSGSYTDENFIVWSGDDDYINNGESHTVQNSNSFSPALNTLRAFTTRKKNCYSIEATKGERVLARATFYYGNYDRKSSPPTFDLQFDGNHWATVETSRAEYVYYEATYDLKWDYVSICVAQTKPEQFPFISAIEVRSLSQSMYDSVDKNYPLHLIARVAYGANATIRYSDDSYDRIWTPATGGDGLTAVSSDAFIIEVSVQDAPPQEVLQNAITALSPTATIQLLNGLLPSTPIDIYLNMYFSEVLQLDATQTRSFQIVMDNEPLLEKPFAPFYGNTTELNAANLTVSSNTSFALVPSKGSTLPPLINAMEVFKIGDELSDGTNVKDVNGLAELQSAFDELQDWSGDPCLPAPYSWDWIECSNDSRPRVTALHLSSFGLTGTLPDFSTMDALETIDLHNNSLDGDIPDFLSTFPNLKQLNLASNQFSGLIPDSLSKKKGLTLVVTDNPYLCTSAKECKTSSNSPTDTPGSNPRSKNSGAKKKKKSKTPVILGTTIPIAIVVWAAVGAKLVLRYRRKASLVSSAGGNRPGSTPLNPRTMGKMGEVMMDEFKIRMDQQNDAVELPVEDQTYQQQHDGTTTTESN